jgi:putative NADH-flavin reductase
MQLAILGGTGGIGGHLLSWALDAGHPVRALARSPGALPPRGGLAVIRGDALDAAAVTETIAGSDTVVSALGPRGAKSESLLAGAAANIVAAMDKTGARRLVCVSAAGAYIASDPNTGRLVKAILPRVFAKQFADTRQMENVIRESGVDWTLVRATRLVNRPGTGRYRVSPDFPPSRGRTIARADVAHFIADALTGNTWLHEAPAVAY